MRFLAHLWKAFLIPVLRDYSNAASRKKNDLLFLYEQYTVTGSLRINFAKITAITCGVGSA